MRLYLFIKVVIVTVCAISFVDSRIWILNVTEANAVIGRNDVPSMTHMDVLSVQYTKEPLSIEFNNAPIKVIPRDIFSKDSLHELICTNTRIQQLNEVDFRGGQNLQTLVITKNPLNTIKSNTFNYLINLEELNLDGNQISSIQSNAFKELFKLKSLRLSSNRISTLPVNIFNDLSNLEVLILQSNQLSSFSPMLVANQKNLRTLNLAINRLTEINLPEIKSLKNLHTLSFFNNRISLIDVQNIHENMPKLAQIYATNNKFPCGAAQNISIVLQTHRIAHMLSGGCILDRNT